MAKRPSSWVNLQDYLGLNQQAGQEMGDRLVGDVSAQAAKAGGAITNAEREFGYRADTGGLAAPDDPEYVKQNKGLFTDDAHARQMSQGGYSGPDSLGDINGDLYGQVSAASDRVKAAQDPSQMGSQLAKAYGGQAASGAGGSALDAFLTGQTSGAALSGLQDNYGGLMNSLGIAEQGAAKTAGAAREQSAKNAKGWADEVTAINGKGDEGAAGGEDGAFVPDGFKDYRSFMDSGGAGQYAHEVAQYASPADWLTRGLGELGYDGEGVSQLFVGRFGVNGNQEGGSGDWNVGNLRSASRLVQDQYGPEAMQAWFKSLDKDSYKELMDTGNPGGQARKMRKWLSENGYQRLR